MLRLAGDVGAHARKIVAFSKVWPRPVLRRPRTAQWKIWITGRLGINKIALRYRDASPRTEKPQRIHAGEAQPSDLMFAASRRAKSKHHPHRFAGRDVVDAFGIPSKLRQTKRNPMPCGAGFIRDLERQRN